ncbi:SGNH/GDSL hydrolase family protein [Actomonas aquatica]|uniref:SGNH/GDSL hydrolase family protein n=1 Tax=Actomonas aquatica TaxID=2866162 RepID=A0ABZ1C6D1_9BACT|nr:SGNH/GDSL hydrolase family protein [Opitutus sp. WL0086]WRQ86943.1 SGNH/GDSL hydrolase family protein [Opitutus sp. WL0086]
MTPQRKRLFWGLLLLFDAAILVGGYFLYRWWHLPDGVELNQLAWESAYRERGEIPPPGGPREGYWGSKLTAHTYDTQFGPLVASVSDGDLYAYDDLGRQFAHSPASDQPRRRLLIMGGSVAGGAYASDAAHTYFSLLAEHLGHAGLPVDITVWAAGGWISEQEVPAARWLLARETFDAVIFVDGLNDLTLYPENPLGRRLGAYLTHIDRIASDLRTSPTLLVVAPQPYLPDKAHRTRIEEKILTAHDFTEFQAFAFEGLMVGLRELADNGSLHLIDCTNVLSAETATTFTDIWHFSDHGHALLAEKLATGLIPLLRAQAPLPATAGPSLPPTES